MRILFVTEEPIDFSGAMVRGGQIHVRNVVQGLRNRGHDVHLIDWNDGATKPFQHSISPQMRFVDGPIRTLGKILSMGRSINPDVIISKTRKVYLPGLIASRRLGIPHVVHVGSSLEPRDDGLVARVDSASKSLRLQASHDAYFVVCDALREELVGRGIDLERIHNVRNAVDPERFRPDPDVELPDEQRNTIQDADRPIVGFVGSISRKKGILDLADAVSTSSIDLTVLVAGDGPAKAELSEKLGNQVYFLGSVPYENMPAVYAAMDVLVLPSHSEGLPRVILEASATAVPIIATRVGGIPEVVDDGRTGLLCGVKDSEALAGMIEKLFEEYDPHDLGKAGRELVVDEYSWEAQYDRYENFLNKLKF